MIIPGKQMVGNDIDVYLQPLIKELKELWFDGVQTFDYSKKEMFTLQATLLWTISDFPRLGNLFGWNIKTGLACLSVTLIQTLVSYTRANFALWDTIDFYIKSIDLD